MNYKTLFSIFIYLNLGIAHAQSPPAAIPNIENIPAGSYIIPVDFEKQSTIRPDLGDEVINTKVYGLIFKLMEKGFPIKWAIKAGKSKNDIDFSARVRKIVPTIESAQMEDFRSGAFLLEVNDFEEVSCITGFFSAESYIKNLIEDFGNEVNIYELVENTDIDIRYSLDFAPKIAILNDGGFEREHTRILNRAGIPFEDISSEVFIDNYSCYTFISQPHLEVLENNEYISSIKDFLNIGGNFYAQCISVVTFENQSNLMSTTGISEGGSDNLAYSYFGEDHPLMQVTGILPSSLVGTMGNFKTNDAYKAGAFSLIQNQENHDILKIADINSNNEGGNIIYMAGHGSGTFTDPNLLKPVLLMDQLYLNSIFMPAGITFACAGEDKCICDGGEIKIGCDKTSSVLNYTWSPSDGLSCSDCPNPIASPNETTNYTLTVSNGANGDCTSDEMTVLVFEDLKLAQLDIFACPTEVVVYAGEILQIGDTKQYSLKTSTGCDSILTVNVLPKSPPRTPIPFVACDGNPVTFMGETILNGETKEFVLQDANGCDSILIVSVSESYFTEVSVGTCPEIPYVYDNTPINIGTTTTFNYTASDGCDSIIDVSVGALVFDILLNPTDASCHNGDDGQVRVSSPTGGTDPYTFSIDDDSYQQDSLFRNLESGLYQLSLKDATGCLETFPFEISEPSPWNVEITTEKDSIISGDAIVLLASHNNSRAVSYSWNPTSDLSCSDCKDPIAKPRRNQNYEVTAIDEEGCIQKDIISIYVLENKSYVPTIFTPNGDGFNDLLMVSFKGQVEKFEFNVFNRWGALIYSESQAIPIGWDGTFKGQAAPEDIYIYSLDVLYSDGKKEILSGDVALLR